MSIEHIVVLLFLLFGVYMAGLAVWTFIEEMWYSKDARIDFMTRVVCYSIVGLIIYAVLWILKSGGSGCSRYIAEAGGCW